MLRKNTSLFDSITQLFFYLVLFIFPFGVLLQIPSPTYPYIHIYAIDISILFASTFFLYIAIRKRVSFYSVPLIKPLSIITFTFILSYLLSLPSHSFKEQLVGALYLIRWILYVVFYTSIFLSMRTSNIFRKKYIFALCIALTLASLFGIIQYLWYHNLRNLIYLGWDPHKYRLFGTFLDTGFAGIIFVLAISLLLYIINTYSRNLFFFLSLLFTFISLLLTYSRSSYLSFLLLVIILFRNKYILLSSLFIFLIGLYTTTNIIQNDLSSYGTNLKRYETIKARIKNSSDALEIIKISPLTGVGYNMLRFIKRDKGQIPYNEWKIHHAASGFDNSFLFITATSGLIGLGTYIYFLYCIFTNNSLYKISKNAQLLIFSSTAALIIHSFFQNTLFYPFSLILWYLLLAIGYSERLD